MAKAPHRAPSSQPPKPALAPPQPAVHITEPTAACPAVVPVTKNTTAKAGGRASKERFSSEDIDVILAWLEHPPNYDKIYGTSRQRSVGKTVSSSKGYAELAAHFNKSSKGRWKLTGRAVKERFNRYKKNNYLAVRPEIIATGFGITDEDRANGIHRLDQKRESMCRGFDRLEALFGTNPNIEPLVEGQFFDEDDDEQEGLLDGEDAEEAVSEYFDGGEEELVLSLERDRQIVEEESDFDLEMEPKSSTNLTTDGGDSSRKRRSSNSASFSATANTRKSRLRLDTGPSQLKGSYATALAEMSKDKTEALKEATIEKLAFKKHVFDMEREERRAEREERRAEREERLAEREYKRAESERLLDMENKKLAAQMELEHIKLTAQMEIEEKKLKEQKQARKFQLAQAAITSGRSMEDIQAVFMFMDSL
ncbi:hypothetical protein BG005_010434 [Podila minutissima]|nr:hypothetical protein BG005_010434 [Podila minutissima]